MNDNINDPLELKNTDQQIRIEQLHRQLEALAGSQYAHGKSKSCTPDMEEKFLERVLAIETAQQTTLKAILEQRGHVFPGPEELDDEALPVRLWELVHALSGIRVFLEFTDHLSDRELYTYLMRDALWEKDVHFPDDPDFACHLDPIGSGSEEHTELYLKYYADELWRETWAEEFPGEIMPEHENPPYDRDRHLPRPQP